MPERYTSIHKTLRGIYAWTCSVNGKRYVGGTRTTFEKRRKNHISTLTNGKHHSPLLQEEWNTYGSEAFEFQILEVVEDVDLIAEREVYWMQELQPEYNGAYVAIGYAGRPERAGVTHSWRQTISDELAARIEARRGPLTVQEYTTFVLAAAVEGQSLAQRLAELERQVAELKRAPQVVGVVGPGTTDCMLSFD